MASSLGIASALALLALAAPSIPNTPGGILAPADLLANDAFGNAVAIDGKLIVVGAPGDDAEGSAAGHAYILRQGARALWTVEDDLQPPELDAGDIFGQSVAIDGKTVLIGAPADDDKGSDTGAVYFFTRRAGGWEQTSKNQQLTPEVDAYFGYSVAVSGKHAIAGAPRWHQFAQTNSGCYALMRRNNDATWTTTTTVFGVQNGGSVGFSVAMAGKVAVVGAPGQDGTGAAHVLRLVGNSWRSVGTLTPFDGVSGDRFGACVATDGKSIVVGAPEHRVNDAAFGAAYVFIRQGNEWVIQDKLVGATVAPGARFGVSIAINGGFVIAGAPNDSEEADAAGAAYLFSRLPGGAWTQYGPALRLEDPAISEYFGSSVAMDKGGAAIGAPSRDATGAVGIFR